MVFKQKPHSLIHITPFYRQGYDIYDNIPYGYVAEITTEPDGDTVEKWYDSEDKIVKVIDGTNITWYTYYDDGRLKSTTKPNGSVSTNTYDDEGNLLTLVTLDAAEDVLDSFTYVYDDNSIGYKNQISKTEIVAGENKGTTSYEYDIQGRLTKVTNPDGSTNEYTYDDAGNRLTKTTTTGETVVVTNYTYDEQNRLTRAVIGNSTTYYGYDNNGNQISEWTRIADNPVVSHGVKLSESNEETDDLMTLYEYDAFDRLIKIEQGADVIENAYTADGKKFSRTIDGYLTYYVYDGNVVIEEQNEDNEESARNVYGRNIITRENAINKIVYGFNGHGDVIYQANTVGVVLVEYNYDEFGNVISEEDVVNSVSTLAPSLAGTADSATETIWASTDSIDNPYRYAGYEYIEKVELYDLNARYYNPEIARFLSADPYYNLGNRVVGVYEINVPNVRSIMQTTALYVYCGNCPVTFFDFTGYWESGDEKLSPQAQVYILYYTDQWEGMHEFYLSAETDEDRNNAKAEMDKIHTKANEIRALDKEGKVVGNVYDVPLYNQESYRLCWAFVQVMYEEYLKDPSERRTQEEAETRAISIAKSVHGYGNDENGNPLWNAGHYPLNAIDLETGNTRKMQIANASQLNNNLSSGPVYARYSNSYLNKNNDKTDDVEKVSAHVVIVTGVVSAPGAPMLIATNNPWGQSNIQTYNNFVNGIPGDKKQMKFEYLYIPGGA